MYFEKKQQMPILLFRFTISRIKTSRWYLRHRSVRVVLKCTILAVVNKSAYICTYCYNWQLAGVWIMVFNTTFNNNSYIVVVSFIVGEIKSTWRKSTTFCKSLKSCYHITCIEYISLWVEFEVKALMVIVTDCIDTMGWRP